MDSKDVADLSDQIIEVIKKNKKGILEVAMSLGIILGDTMGVAISDGEYCIKDFDAILRTARNRALMMGSKKQ